MVPDETGERRRQRRGGQPLAGDEHHRLVEAPRLPPLLGEEAALDRRQRRLPLDRTLGGRPGIFHAAGDGGEPGDRLVLEELPGGDEEPLPAGPRHHLDAQDRVAAELEEVVVDPHPLEAEHLAPDRRQQLLPGVPGRGRARARLARRLRRGQGLEVHLAVGGERQHGQGDESRGHHVLRQAVAQKGLKLRGRHRRAFGDDVGHEPCVRSGSGARHHHHRLPHSRMGRELDLDLPRLDAEAADLDLQVGAAEELERAVRQAADEVAGPVVPPPLRSTNRSAVSSSRRK